VTLSNLINRPCVLIRRSTSGTADRYGDDQPGEQLIPSVWQVQQRQRTETAEGQVSETEWLAFFLTGTVLDTNDAIVDDDLGTFELVGDPWDAREGSPSMWHVEATVKRVGGPGDVS
jgi:hypothetical protein